MGNRGVGAQIAWSIESKRVLSDLAKIFHGSTFERINFEEGEALRNIVLDTYARAQKKGTIRAERFGDRDELALAIRQRMNVLPSDDVMNIFLQDSERKGVYRTTRRVLAKCAVDLLVYDGSCIFFASNNGREGYLLDYESDATNQAPFEMEQWQI